MKVTYHRINFNVKDVAREELPMTDFLYTQDKKFWDDVEDLLAFPISHKNNMPFYTMSTKAAENMADTFGQVYNMLIESLKYLFKEDFSVVKHFFGKEFMEKHSYFYDYAKYTFRNGHPALYGRFDSAYNPETDEVAAIYEFNGNTPVMLFESVLLENRFVREITGDSYAQSNDFYEMLSLFANKMRIRDSFAVICDTNFIEDTATCETFAQIFNDKAFCVFDDIENLSYDFAKKEGSPFFVNDINVSDIFLLSPWEELLELRSDFFKDWRKWVDSVNFYEPAWRWFISNKGIWAYVTHLLETNVEFAQQFGHLPVVPTYMSNETFLAHGEKYVQKPLIGRLSMNIRIVDPMNKDNSIIHESEGGYGEEQCVYQLYHAPYKVADRNNFITCYWMAPVLDEDGLATGVKAEPATACFREFDQPVLSISNERFIPHLIVD